MPSPKLIVSLLLLLACLSMHAQTQPVYQADPKVPVHSLRAFTRYFVDSTGSFQKSDIVSGKLDSAFKPLDTNQSKANSGPAYWLQFNINSSSNINDWWLLLVSDDIQAGYYTRHNYVNVYRVKENGSVDSSIAGIFVPRSKRSVKEIAAINRVVFSGTAGETQKIYIRIQNQLSEVDGVLLPHPEIRDPSIPIPVHPATTTMQDASTVAFVVCLLSLCFFFFVRDKAYLFFSCYVLFHFFHYKILHPEMPILEWMPEHPTLVSYCWRIFTMGSFVFFFLFGRSFISLRQLSEKTDRLLKYFLVLWTAVGIVNLTGIYFYKTDLNSIFFFPLFLIALGFLIRLAFFKTALSRIYVAGALWLIIWSILGGLWNYGIVTLPVNPWLTGQYGELLIYCFGLAYKIRLNERAKAEADHIKELDEIKSKFFANISHEFRTPLTLIQGPLQQIAEPQKEEATVMVPWRKIKIMRRNADRLLELVNQLLDLSRLDSGKMRMRVSKGDIMQVLKTLAASFESMAERKQIHYHMHFPDQSPLVYFDRDKLEKIVSNLLANAFKYTPESGSISLNADIDEKRLRLSVEDSGPGIAKRELDKVFDRFYQSEGNEDKGSGIGLALVKELTDLYRGQISVSSEPGKGTRFRISLPVDHSLFREDELGFNERQPSFEAEEETLATNGSDDRPLLLVVEDNKDLRQHICEIAAENYIVIQAVNGKDGYEKAIAEIPDIIVSDVMMPIMDGITLCSKLKKDERTSHIPVILLTAKAGQMHKVEGLETGADDYLTKPFDQKELQVRLQNLVNQRKLLRRKFAGEIVLRPSEVSVNSADNTFLNKVMDVIESNMSEEEFGVEELAKAVAMSRSQLHRKLTALTGQAPSGILRNARLLRAKELLQKKAATPSEVAFRVGFNSHTYFSKCFKEEFGLSPSEIT